jgi:hypothetical protein
VFDWQPTESRLVPPPECTSAADVLGTPLSMGELGTSPSFFEFHS